MDNATPVGSGTLPTTDADAALDLTGKTLGDYHILRRLGTGGMGQVYLAEQVSLMRKVALKLLRADLAANPKALDRFKQEALAVAQATHANIVQVYAIGDQDGMHFMALEFVEGRNLREYLERKGPPELLISLSIMRQVAAALQRASELGIIHRDIKPENILITKKGEVKVADFGLSRVYSEGNAGPSITQSGVSMGTPLYMSPEQVEAKKNIDCRTDIYSFGVTSYHLLAGQPPFRGDNAWEVATQHVQKEPPALAEIRPDLPADLCLLVHKMMAKNPDDRPQTAREIVRELVRLRDLVVGVTGAPGGHTSGLHWIGSAIALGPVPPHAADAASTQHVLKPRRSRSLLWLAALLSILVAGGLGIFIGYLQNRSDANTNGDAKIVNPSPDGTDPAKLREADLKKKFDDTKDLKAAIDLSAFLVKEGSLHEGSLKKAFEFAKDLEKSPTESFRVLGYLDHAMVLSYQDHARASNLLFMAVLLTGKPGAIDAKDRILSVAEVRGYLQKNKKGPLRLLLENPEVPDMIADAVAVAHRDEPRKAGEYFMKNMLFALPKKDPSVKVKPLTGEELTLKKVMEERPSLKVVLESPSLREVIADALQRNRANLPLGKKKNKDEQDPEDSYPRVLRELRRPWNPS